MPPSSISSRCWYWPLPRSATVIAASERTRITSRSVSRTSRVDSAVPVGRVAGEGRALDVGLVLALHDVVDHRTARQLGQQGVEEVVVHRRWRWGGRAGPSSIGPERQSATSCRPTRSGRVVGDLGGQQPAANPKVGPVDDLADLVVGLAQGEQGFRSGTAGGGAYGPVDVGPEVEVAGHHGDRGRVVAAEARDDDQRRSPRPGRPGRRPARSRFASLRQPTLPPLSSRRPSCPGADRPAARFAGHPANRVAFTL